MTEVEAQARELCEEDGNNPDYSYHMWLAEGYVFAPCWNAYRGLAAARILAESETHDA